MPNPYSNLDADDFQGAALGMLPPGRAYPRDPTTILGKFWGAIADMMALFHQTATNLVDEELNPATTSLLLPDFEQDFGLPEPCTPLGATVAQRRAALLAKITNVGSLSRQSYIDAAATLGYPITITEFKRTTCISKCTDPVVGDAWRFAWQVNAPAVTITTLNCLGRCNEPLRNWGNEELECVIRRRNRPSRIVLFSYG